MKTVENKTTSMLNEKEKKITYADLIKVCLNKAPEGGFSPEEMRKRMRVFGPVSAAKDNGKIKLEDNDIETIKSCVSTMMWLSMHEELVKFMDYIEGL